ncbi:MAG: penicillin-binding transpeptidase domain-containing protein [Acidobacteriaceae bacterium]
MKPISPNTERHATFLFFLVLAAAFLMMATPSVVALAGATTTSTTATPSAKKARTRASALHENARVHHRMVARRHHHSVTRVHYRRVYSRRHHRYYERFTASSFADNQTADDVTAGEDPVVRQAAIDALGNMHGTVVVINPYNGRILAMVDQKLALSSGAEPCSTIKLSVGLAALEEGIITKDTPVDLGGHYHLTLTEALAHSNNLYFETVGRRLGFERVKHYANMFGLGELAGYDIPGEQLGVYPDQELPEKLGGVGRMCSFGESVSMTPLQLGALVSAIANGGTLYYLQHPQTPEEASNFTPRIKRQLDIGPLLPQMTDGMAAAVRYGTARSLRTNFTEFPVLGKTGTCSNNGTRFGWFASYADTPSGRVVAVFFLEGGRPTFGPKAAELAGVFYRNLEDHSYFTTLSEMQSHTPTAATPVAMPTAAH